MNDIEIAEERAEANKNMLEWTELKELWMLKAFGFIRDKFSSEFIKNHIFRVVHILNIAMKGQKYDHAIMLSAALLHDVLEDTNVTYDQLLKEFGPTIANLVLEVTHEKSKDGGYCFPRLKSREAIVLKYADRLANLSSIPEFWRGEEERIDKYYEKSRFWKSN